MTPDQFHDALTLLPADLVAEGEAFRSRRPKILSWKHCAAMAACFVLLLGVATFARTHWNGIGSDLAEMEQMAAEAAPMEEAMEEALDTASNAAPARGDTHSGTTVSRTLEEPPMLDVVSGGNALTLEAHGYTWNIPQEDGSTMSLCADVPNPTDDPDRYLVLDSQAEAANLRWEVMPQSIFVRCWHREDLETPKTVELHGATMPFFRGLHLYEVTAQWEQGQATYVFSVNTLR